MRTAPVAEPTWWKLRERRFQLNRRQGFLTRCGPRRELTGSEVLSSALAEVLAHSL